jgi:glycosyltransferase involved in cell wall biosynthesis
LSIPDRGRSLVRIVGFHSQLDVKRGSSLAFLNIALALKKRGHEVAVYSFQVDEWYRSILEEAGIASTSVDHRHLEPLGVHLIMTNNSRARGVFKRLRTEFKAFDVAYLHGNQWTPLALPVLNMPKVYYCDEPPRHYHEPDLLNVTIGKKMGKAIGFLSRRSDRNGDRRSVAHADAVTTNSDYTRSYIKRVYGIDATTVYPGVDHEVFSPDPVTDKEHMVVSVGAIYPLKAHEFIVRSLANIPEDERPRLVVIGRGDHQLGLEALARAQGVRLEVVSEIDTTALASYYRRAKLTVVAHVREPFGLVAIESQSCGTPVVAVDEAGLKETVTEETGILTPRDEMAFSRAVRELLTDPDERDKMGIRGRERVREVFNWDRTAEVMESVIDRAVASRGTGQVAPSDPGSEGQ